MSLKTAFASVLKATRAARGLSQKNLAEVSSRTYISKLERGQCSPTLEMMSALSVPLGVGPLTLIAMTISTETGEPVESLLALTGEDLAGLARVCMIGGSSQPSPDVPLRVRAQRSDSRQPLRPTVQTEFSFHN